jgi:hypothetical protein
MDSARYVMMAHCGAGGQPKLALLCTHTRLWCCCHMRRWAEPVHFPLSLFQTKHNGSLAPAQANMDSARYVVVAQCSVVILVGGKFENDSGMRHAQKFMFAWHYAISTCCCP